MCLVCGDVRPIALATRQLVSTACWYVYVILILKTVIVSIWLVALLLECHLGDFALAIRRFVRTAPLDRLGHDGDSELLYRSHIVRGHDRIVFDVSYEHYIITPLIYTHELGYNALVRVEAMTIVMYDAMLKHFMTHSRWCVKVYICLTM